jgi:hypothetical protein
MSMKISVDTKGSDYLLTTRFDSWLSRQLQRRITPSAQALQKYGNDWTLSFAFCADGTRKRPKAFSPILYRGKKVEWLIEVRDVGGGLGHPKRYVLPFKQFVEGIALVLRQLDIDVSQMLKDLPKMAKQFASNPRMVGRPGTPIRKHGKPTEGFIPYDPSDYEPKKPQPRRRRKLPHWNIPKNVASLAENTEGFWETGRFDPIQLLVYPHMANHGRKVRPWEIQFDPYDGPFANAAQQINSLGTEPDGDAWAEYIETAFAKRYPRFAREIQSDSEMSTCVLRVPSEEACRKLVAVIWSMIYRS